MGGDARHARGGGGGWGMHGRWGVMVPFLDHCDHEAMLGSRLEVAGGGKARA